MAGNKSGRPRTGANFDIEDKDEDGCLWVCNPAGTEPVWCVNLGPREAVMAKWADFLGQKDFGE
jgi:hypothetical protein